MNAVLKFFSCLVVGSLAVACTSDEMGTRVKSENSFYFKLQLSSDRPFQDTLYIRFLRNPTFSERTHQGEYLQKRLDQDNPIELRLASILDLGRLEIMAGKLGDLYLLQNQIIEPGDSIHAMVKVENERLVKIEYSGRGAAKYRLYELMESFRSAWRDTEFKSTTKELDPVEAMDKYETLRQSHLKDLKKHKKELNPLLYQVLQADAVGLIGNLQLEVLSRAYAEADSAAKLRWRSRLDQFITADVENVSAKTLGLSRVYLEFEYQKSKWKVVYAWNKNYKPYEFYSYNRNVRFIDLYKRLKRDYSGLLRENVLSYAVLNPTDINLFFDGCPADDLTWCLSDAAELIKTPHLQQSIREKLERVGKGAEVYNFSLRSTTGELVSLSDLKGKIVLIDIWINGCGGCLYFNKKFEEIVNPYIKNREDVKVVSISTEPDYEKWLHAIEVYSNPEHINLSLEGEDASHPLMEFYDISYAPFILLVDREGKLISASNRNCENLLALIKEELAAS